MTRVGRPVRLAGWLCIAGAAAVVSCQGAGDEEFNEPAGAQVSQAPADSTVAPTTIPEVTTTVAATTTIAPLDVVGLDPATIWPADLLGPLGPNASAGTLPARPAPADGPPDPGPRVERSVFSADGRVSLTLRSMALSTPALGQAWWSAWDAWLAASDSAGELADVAEPWRFFLIEEVPKFGILRQQLLMARTSNAVSEVVVLGYEGPALEAPDLPAAAAAIARVM